MVDYGKSKQDMLATESAVLGFDYTEFSNIQDIDNPELDRREVLLRIAAEYFLLNGYSATSVDEIADAAGTSGPALYRLFDSKQDILDQVCLTGMEVRLKGVLKAIDKKYEDPRDTLRDLVRSRIEFAFGPWGCQVPIIMAEYKHLSPAAAMRMDTGSQIGSSEWFRYLTRIRPEAPAQELLSVLYAVLLEISYVALYVDELDIGDDVRPILERLALAALTADY